MEDEKIKASETRIFKAVFPNTTNHYDTLFGGTAMHLKDEVAFITATRFSRQRMVTVSSDRIDFKKTYSRWYYSRINRKSKLYWKYKPKGACRYFYRTDVF